MRGLAADEILLPHRGNDMLPFFLCSNNRRSLRFAHLLPFLVGHFDLIDSFFLQLCDQSDTFEVVVAVAAQRAAFGSVAEFAPGLLLGLGPHVED